MVSPVDDLKSQAADLMKKVLTVGVGALFLTEESLRALVQDFKLPKELLTAVLDSANKTKNEFMRTLSQDVIARVADKVDPTAMIQDLLARNEVEFTVKVNFKPRAKKSTGSTES